MAISYLCLFYLCVCTIAVNPLVHEDIFKHDLCFHRFYYDFVSAFICINYQNKYFRNGNSQVYFSLSFAYSRATFVGNMNIRYVI